MYKGIRLVDPFGDPQWMFPLLYAYIYDHPKAPSLHAPMVLTFTNYHTTFVLLRKNICHI